MRQWEAMNSGKTVEDKKALDVFHQALVEEARGVLTEDG